MWKMRSTSPFTVGERTTAGGGDTDFAGGGSNAGALSEISKSHGSQQQLSNSFILLPNCLHIPYTFSLTKTAFTIRR